MADNKSSDATRSVMIIDDDEINNFLCKKIIEVTGLAQKVVTFLGARQGIDFLKKGMKSTELDLPDLILLDINMPVMNGWDFIDEFRRIGVPEIKDIPIVILSSSVYQKDMDKSQTYNEVKEFVSKPLTSSVVRKIGELYLS